MKGKKKELKLKATVSHLAMFCSFKRWRSGWDLAWSPQSAGLACTKSGVQSQAHTCNHSPGVGRYGDQKFKTIPSHIRSSRPAWVKQNPILNKTKQNPVRAQYRDAVLSLSICSLLSCGCGTGRDGGPWSILLLLCGPRLCSVHPSCLNLFTSL